MDPAELRQAVDALVGRHLVLREADGSFSVHPAVRDHFYRLAGTTEGGAWHDIIREQFISLVQRPGRGLPEDARTLDMIEEAIYHARQAGRIEEALRLFNDVLGGLRHLAWKLGEMGRGLRILRGFEPCPDRWALAWFLRALGEFEEAYRHNELPFFRADIRLLQGRLPQVAAEGEATRTAIAAFLMGQTSALPSQPLSCPIPRDQLLIYLGRFHQILQSTVLEGFYHEIGWEGDRARCQLVLAEAAGRQGNHVFCRNHLELATKWILHSGSVEHLCFMHLVRARLERACEAWETAQGALSEGLHLARHRGLGLYLVELLCEQAELFLARKDAVQAEPAAREALRLASQADCQFVWGAAEAGHGLGRALAVQQRIPEARAILDKTLGLRRRLGDPRAALTERLLGQLPNT
jgi:tetratricopeptide (TPR) repeat protein